MELKNSVESYIELVCPPMSIRQFDKVKKNSQMKAMLDKANIYIIAQREPCYFNLDGIKTKGHLNLLQLQVVKGTDKIVIIIQESEKNLFLVRKGFAELHGKSFKVGSKLVNEIILSSYIDDDLKKEEEVGCFTFDELFYFISHDEIDASILGNINPFITFNILYVGECVNETLSQRFRAHHALQKMLINEECISENVNNSDELFIFPLTTQSDIISVLDGSSDIEDFERVLYNNYSFNNDTINLDIEKALVHGLNPKYNEVRFKNYPMSKNGLYNTEANLYVYSLNENIFFNYANGKLIGCVNTSCSSKIVADQNGSFDIFLPGEVFIDKYINWDNSPK